MKSISSIFFITFSVSILTLLYYFIQFNFVADKVFLSISTFLFSIFTGFFVSRQASRFNRVREKITEFAGKMSGIYRASGHINSELQEKIGEILLKHYKKIQKTGKWNIHYIEKSSTLTDIHKSLEKYVIDEDVTKLANQSLGAVVKGLDYCQDIRKQVVTLYEERIPVEQWVLIIFFATMLVATVSAVSSTGLMFASILKAAFVISVFSVLYILYRLNELI